jgi:hypothetical protein
MKLPKPQKQLFASQLQQRHTEALSELRVKDTELVKALRHTVLEQVAKVVNAMELA